jgi:hypothetical protein
MHVNGIQTGSVRSQPLIVDLEKAGVLDAQLLKGSVKQSEVRVLVLGPRTARNPQRCFHRRRHDYLRMPQCYDVPA